MTFKPSAAKDRVKRCWVCEADAREKRRQANCQEMPGDNLEIPASLSPRWSITAVKSIDLDADVPSVFAAMDAEDSPWGGLSPGSEFMRRKPLTRAFRCPFWLQRTGQCSQRA